jgi:hypothetical protein
MKPLPIALVADAPELAMLDVLRHTLQSTTTALLAADPGMFCEPPPSWVPLPQSTRIAERIVELADQLLEALGEYQRAVELALERQRQRERERRRTEDGDIPF